MGQWTNRCSASSTSRGPSRAPARSTQGRPYAEKEARHEMEESADARRQGPRPPGRAVKGSPRPVARASAFHPRAPLRRKRSTPRDGGSGCRAHARTAPAGKGGQELRAVGGARQRVPPKGALAQKKKHATRWRNRQTRADKDRARREERSRARRGPSRAPARSTQGRHYAEKEARHEMAGRGVARMQGPRPPGRAVKSSVRSAAPASAFHPRAPLRRKRSTPRDGGIGRRAQTRTAPAGKSGQGLAAARRARQRVPPKGALTQKKKHATRWRVGVSRACKDRARREGRSRAPCGRRRPPARSTQGRPCAEKEARHEMEESA